MVDKNKNYTDRELLLLNIQSTEQINKRLDKFETTFVTKSESAALKHEIEELRKDFADYKIDNNKQISELRGKKVIRDTVLWVGLTASAIINVIALYNIFSGE